jgi:hypothetical protein
VLGLRSCRIRAQVPSAGRVSAGQPGFLIGLENCRIDEVPAAQARLTGLQGPVEPLSKEGHFFRPGCAWHVGPRHHAAPTWQSPAAYLTPTGQLAAVWRLVPRPGTLFV